MSAKAKALEKQAANEAARKKKAEDDAEREEAAKWSVGAKDSARQRAEEEKEAQRRQKAAEKAALMAAEEAELSTVQRTVKTKKKGKDDLDVLNAVLAQQPKTKQQKEAEKKKKEAEERRKKEAEAAEAKEARRKAEEEEIKRLAAKGIVMNHTDDLFIPLNNRLEEDDFEDVSGLDAALDVLSVGKKVDDHPERRMKAAYNAYYAATLPVLKEEQPGLKLSQYRERIWEMWKTAPENPKNQAGRKVEDAV
eukprot:gene27987-33796_t